MRIYKMLKFVSKRGNVDKVLLQSMFSEISVSMALYEGYLEDDTNKQCHLTIKGNSYVSSRKAEIITISVSVTTLVFTVIGILVSLLTNIF